MDILKRCIWFIFGKYYIFICIFYIWKFISMCSYFYIAKNSHKCIVRGKWKKRHALPCGSFIFFNVPWAKPRVLRYSNNVLYLSTVYMVPTWSSQQCKYLKDWTFLFDFLFELSFFFQLPLLTQRPVKVLICNLEIIALGSFSNLFLIYF